MHDPMVLAHEIIRPWPQHSTLPPRAGGERWEIRLHHTHHDDCGCPPGRNPFPWWRPRSYSRFWLLAGHQFYWPALVTVWHVEPGGRDALSVCSHRYQDKRGNWRYTRGWRWHVHHWHLQVPMLQGLRRWALTRCAWCGGRSRKGDPVNISHSWDGPRGRWWQGEPGLYHQDCSAVMIAHGKCFCDDPLLRSGTYGECLVCDKFRAWGREPDEADRLLRAIPAGERIPEDRRPQLEAAWAVRKARQDGAAT